MGKKSLVNFEVIFTKAINFKNKNNMILPFRLYEKWSSAGIK